MRDYDAVFFMLGVRTDPIYEACMTQRLDVKTRRQRGRPGVSMARTHRDPCGVPPAALGDDIERVTIAADIDQDAFDIALHASSTRMLQLIRQCGQLSLTVIEMLRRMELTSTSSTRTRMPEQQLRDAFIERHEARSKSGIIDRLTEVGIPSEWIITSRDALRRPQSNEPLTPRGGVLTPACARHARVDACRRAVLSAHCPQGGRQARIRGDGHYQAE